MKKLSELRIKIFADGADRAEMLQMYSKNYISGLTTNPTLMKRAGIINYKEFCQDILTKISDKPISFEVFSDDFREIEKQALEIASWGKNVYVKIPVTNTKNYSTNPLIRDLVLQGVKINVTAIMTVSQVEDVAKVLDPSIPSYVSIFAGRIADTGRDPTTTIKEALKIMKLNKNSEIIWASPRELLNIYQADALGCHVITVSRDILNKFNLIGYDLEEFSLDTVKMFYNDAKLAGYCL